MNKILMIGDQIQSDIKFAINCNIDSCLVLSGKAKLEDIKPLNEPTFVLNHAGL